MSLEIKREISCFTADFRDGKVTVGGRTFPSGYFFVNSMNEYWKPYNDDDTENFEIAAKLVVMHQGRDNIQDELALNYLYHDHVEKLYADIQYFLKNIAQAKPFCFLDMETERKRCKRIFGKENIQLIIDYLRERSFFNFEHDSGWSNHALPRQSDIDRFRNAEIRLQEFINTVKFYDDLGHGMVNAREIGKVFIKALESPVKRSESNLIAIAMECIEKYRPKGFTEFERFMQVDLEYVQVPKNKNQKTFEVGRRMTFKKFGDFLFTDFFEGLHAGHYPLRCGVCKQYFLQTTAHRRKYCTGFDPNDPKGRSCETVAARSNRLAKESAPDHPVKLIYNRRRGTIDKHLQRGKITKEQADAAKRYIGDLLYKALSDNKYFLEHYKDDMEQDAVYSAVGIKL